MLLWERKKIFVWKFFSQKIGLNRKMESDTHRVNCHSNLRTDFFPLFHYLFLPKNLWWRDGYISNQYLEVHNCWPNSLLKDAAFLFLGFWKFYAIAAVSAIKVLNSLNWSYFAVTVRGDFVKKIPPKSFTLLTLLSFY